MVASGPNMSEVHRSHARNTKLVMLLGLDTKRKKIEIGKYWALDLNDLLIEDQISPTI